MTENAAPRTPALYRAVTVAGQRYLALGPLEDGRYGAWDHEAATYVGRYERADDAVDMMMEVAYS